MTDIQDTVGSIAKLLQQVSGLPDFEANVCAYYCLATWRLKHVEPFPILDVTGPTGTGKSQLLLICRRVTFNAHHFTATKMTGPTFRDELAQAHDGTAIIDEADSADDYVEQLLNNRYMRETAVAAKKIPTAIGGWSTEYIHYYGPSIIHKRVPFKDPSLEGRSITISTVPNFNRKYIKANEIGDDLITKLRAQQSDIIASTNFVEKNYDIPEDVAPRVVDSYRPLIVLAKMAEDDEFLELLWTRLKEATQNLKDGQSYEPGPTVVQALISLLTKNGVLVIRNVKIEGELMKTIQYDFGHNLNSPQIARILRGYGFTLRRIGGPNSVIPDIRTLAKVCKSIGIEDEAVEKAVKRLENTEKPG